MAFGDEVVPKKRFGINLPVILAVIVVLLVIGAAIYFVPTNSGKTSTDTITVLTPGPDTVTTSTLTTPTTLTETSTLTQTSVSTETSVTTSIPPPNVTTSTVTRTTPLIICCQTTTTTVTSGTQVTSITSTVTASGTTISTTILGVVKTIPPISGCNAENNYVWTCNSPSATFNLTNNDPTNHLCLTMAVVSQSGQSVSTFSGNYTSGTPCGGAGGHTVTSNQTVAITITPATSGESYSFQFNISF